jgi:hypothetical protein
LSQPLVGIDPVNSIAFIADADEIILGNSDAGLAEIKLEHLAILEIDGIGRADVIVFVADETLHHSLLSVSTQRIHI